MMRFITIMLFTGLASCSSIQSIENPNQASSQGLHYFMPQKDFLVTITVKEEKVSDVALATTAAYPDLSTPYVLKYDKNLLGTNKLDVVLGENGLLTFIGSETKSRVVATLQNLVVPTDGKQRDPEDKDYIEETTSLAENGCEEDKKYTFIHKTVGKYLDCGLTITIKKYGNDAKIMSHTVKENKAISGVFYRQNRPYLMTVKGKNIQNASIVFSPSEAKTQFIPLSKTFFADNSASLDFRDGVLTRYSQNTEGELSSFLTLPAEIIKAYFSAAGSIFPTIGNGQNPQETTKYRAYQTSAPLM